MKIIITTGSSWYEHLVGKVFDLVTIVPEKESFVVFHQGIEKCTSMDNAFIFGKNSELFQLGKKVNGAIQEMKKAIEEAELNLERLFFLADRVDEELEKTQKNSSRKKVIEQAKNEIRELTIGYDGKLTKVKFYVNPKKRTVVASLNGFATGRCYSKGKAKCAPDDTFNVHIGKAIAFYRALGEEVPSYLLKAPRPVTPEVGDIITIGDSSYQYKIVDKRDGRFSIKAINDISTLFNFVYYDVQLDQCEIIDDSKDDNE